MEIKTTDKKTTPTTPRPADRGGNKPIAPEKLGATDRLHRRVEGLIAAALKFGCDRCDVVHLPDTGGAREVVISTLALRLSDEHPTARSIVDAVVLTLQDEASTLPATDSRGARAWHAFSIRGIRSDDASEVVRERVRLMGTAARPPGEEGAALAVRERGELREDDHALEQESGIAMHPREVATLSGVARQQMRHNEALVGTVVRGFGSVAEQQSRLVEQLSGRVISLTERLEKQSDLFLDAARRARLVEAEARAEEAKGRAIEVTAEVLKEFLPVALHRISRKYGLAGDAEIDPMIEKLIETFTEDQLPALASVLKPAQQALFAEFWIKVQDRKEQRAKEEKKIGAGAGDAPKLGEGS